MGFSLFLLHMLMRHAEQEGYNATGQHRPILSTTLPALSSSRFQSTQAATEQSSALQSTAGSVPARKPRREVPLPSQEKPQGVLDYALFVTSSIFQLLHPQEC